MSVRLMAAVWDSDLPHDEKFVALALADWADDDGRSVYPSQALIAWKVGKTDRAVRETLRRLIERGVLVKVEGAGGGRGITVHYRFVAAALPVRPPYERPRRNPEETTGIENPEVNDTKPGSERPETRKPTSDDPSVIRDDPSEQHRARVQGILEGIADGSERHQAIRDTFAGAFRERKGNRTQRERMARLVRRGATVEDAKHACEVANAEQRDDAFAYALGVMEGCVKAREEGRDPYEGRSQAAGRGNGRGVRDRGAGPWAGDRRNGSGRNGRGRTAAAHVPVRASD